MKKLTVPAVIVAVTFMSACSTPVIHLTDPQSGQTTHCGGDAGASIAGGLAGYYLQQKKDQDCVRLRQSEGFNIDRVEMK